MAFSEKIRLIFDIDDNAAVGSFGRIRGSINDADGARDKFGAGLKSTGDFLKANMAASALAAGAALAAFGVKAVGAFQETALAAGKFAGATGLAVEDASRWIEVAGDIGVEAGTIEGAFTKMNLAIANGKPALKEYGVEIVTTKDGLIDANATFINAATTIGAIEDSTLRTKAAQEIFGKSYGEVSELMNMSAGDLKAALDGVSEAKVIDQDELDKARDFRDRMDNLKGAFEDVQLAAGELIVGMSPVITKVADIAEGIIGVTTAVADFVFAAKDSTEEAKAWWEAVGGTGAMSRGRAINGFMEEVNGHFGNLSNIDKATTALGFFGDAVVDGAEWDDAYYAGLVELFDKVAVKSPEMAEQLLTDFGKLRAGTDETSVRFQEWATAVGLTDTTMIELANRIPGTVTAVDDAGVAVEDMGEKAKIAAFRVETLEGKWADLKAEVDDDKAFFDIQGTFIDLQTTAEEAWIATAEGAEGAEEKAREYTGALLDAKGEVIDYLSEVLKLPPERSTKILAAFDEGNMQFVEDQLAILSRNRTMSLSILAKGGTGNITVNGRGFGVGATGGIVTQPTMALIGEAGPEAVVPLSQMPGASPLPSGLGSGSSSGGGDRSINIYTQANPNDVVAAIKQYERLNGRGWRS